MFSFDRFESLRFEKGITKKSIAEAIGRTSSTIQDWKTGKANPSVKQLRVVADILDTTPEYLNCETDEKENPTSKGGSGMDKKHELLIFLFDHLTDEQQKFVVAQLQGLMLSESGRDVR